MHIPNNSIAKSVEFMENRVKALESAVRPSKAKLDRRLAELKARLDRETRKVEQAQAQAKRDFYDTAGHHEVERIQLQAAIAAIGKTLTGPSSDTVLDLTRRFLSDETRIDRGAAVSEIAECIKLELKNPNLNGALTNQIALLVSNHPDFTYNEKTHTYQYRALEAMAA